MVLSRQRDITGKISLSRLAPDSRNGGYGGWNDLILINPLTREPYIPGSAIKDSLKTVIERACRKAAPRGAPRPFSGSEKAASTLFGSAPGKNPLYGGPSRLVIRDALPVDAKRAAEFAAGGADFPPLELSLNIGLRVYEDTLDIEEEMLELLLCGLRALVKESGGALRIEDARLDGGRWGKI